MPLRPFSGDIWLAHVVILCGGVLALSLSRILLKSSGRWAVVRDIGTSAWQCIGTVLGHGSIAERVAGDSMIEEHEITPTFRVTDAPFSGDFAGNRRHFSLAPLSESSSDVTA